MNNYPLKMEIINHPDGGTTILNPNAEYMRFCALITGLKLEIRTNGQMKLTRGPKCSTLARRMGIKGNRETQLALLLIRKEELARELGLIKE